MPSIHISSHWFTQAHTHSHNRWRKEEEKENKVAEEKRMKNTPNKNIIHILLMA